MTAREDPGSTVRFSSAARRLVVAVAAGVLAGAVAVPLIGVLRGLIAAWSVTAGVSLAWTWLVVWGMDAERTERYAAREDESRPVRDVVLLVAAMASLLAVAAVLVRGKAAPGRLLDVVVSLTAVALSWGVVHTVFALRYARLYYGGSGENGGIDFNQDAAPSYRDFAYVAFTLGMTFQVSDTTITDGAIRATTLRHALLAYAFGTVVIAVTVNVLAGLGS